MASQNIRYENAAVGKPCGEAEFLLNDNSNSHLPGYYVGGNRHKWLNAEAQLKRIRIPCFSLDQLYLDRCLPKPNLIKLDIEGAEKDGLSFAGKLVSEARPLIVLELHNRECDEAAWHFAQNVGYRIISLDSGLPLIRKEDVMGTLLLHDRSDASGSSHETARLRLHRCKSWFLLLFRMRGKETPRHQQTRRSYSVVSISPGY